MKTSFFCLLLFGLAGSLVQAQFDGGNNTALAALAALPQDCQDSVLRLSADHATPNPATWYAMARAGGTGGTLRSLQITDAKVVSNKASLNLVALARNPTPVDQKKVLLDSPRVYDFAQEYCTANAGTLASASFALTQGGAGAVPLWEIWCYNASGTELGYLKMSALDGVVISTKGFSNTP